jgi:ornithine carbamoyltransferase
MSPSLKHRSLASFESMAPRDASALLASADTLRRAAEAGATQPLLRGKNFGLMSEADDEAGAALFRRSVVELGGHVAHIRTSLSARSTGQEVQHTARMLGRLYDAVECQGLASDIVQRVGDDAGVPVFDGIACHNHPTAKLIGQLGGDTAPADARRFVLQAVLLGALA